MSDDKRAIQLKDQIWFLMYDAERNHLYFRRLMEKNRLISRLINFGLLLATIASAGSLVGGPDLTNIWSAIITYVSLSLNFFIIATLTILEITFQYSRNAGIAEVTSRQARDIASETKRLHRKLNAGYSIDDLTEKADVLQGLLNGVTSVDLPSDEDIEEEANEDAAEQLIVEFPEGRPAAEFQTDPSRTSTET